MRVSAVFKRIKVVPYNPIVFLLRQSEIIMIRFKKCIAFGEPYEVRHGILIKVPDVILEELAPVNDVPQVSTLLRDGDAERVLQSQRGSHRVRSRTNSANSLREIYGVKGIPALQHFLKAPEKQTLRPRVRYNVVINIGVDFHKPADAGNGVDDNSLRFVHLFYVVSKLINGSILSGNPNMAQPMHGLSSPMGQFTRSFHFRIGQSTLVTGPLHPSLNMQVFSPSFEAKIP